MHVLVLACFMGEDRLALNPLEFKVRGQWKEGRLEKDMGEAGGEENLKVNLSR